MAYNQVTASRARKKQTIAAPASSRTPPNATEARTATSTPLAAYATNDERAGAQHPERPYYENSDGDEEGYEKRTNVMEVDERRRQLEEDDWTAEVEPKRVRCRGCKRWIKLDARSLYYRGFWDKHRDLCRSIKRILGIPILQRTRRLHSSSGSTKRARGTIPVRSTTKVSRKTKASDTSRSAKPGAQVRAPTQAGDSNNATREAALSAHSVQDVPGAPGDCLSTRIDKDRAFHDTSSFASAQHSSVFADNRDRLPLASSNLVASVTNNRRLNSVAETRSNIVLSMQAACDKGRSRTTWSRSVDRMDVEEHPVMGRRIVAGSGRQSQAAVHCKQWWDAGDAQSTLMGPGLPVQHHKNSTASGSDRRALSPFSEMNAIQRRVPEAPFVSYICEDASASNSTPSWREDSTETASGGLALAQNPHQTPLIDPTRPQSQPHLKRNAEPTRITDYERSGSVTPPSYDNERDASRAPSPSRHGVEEHRFASNCIPEVSCDGPGNQAAQRQRALHELTSTHEADRTLSMRSIPVTHEPHVNEPEAPEAASTFRGDFEHGTSRNAQRYPQSTEFVNYEDPSAVPPGPRDGESRGLRTLTAARESGRYTGDSPAWDEDTRPPVIPTPTWADLAHIDLVDPRIPVELGEQSSRAAKGRQTEGQPARGQGSWRYEDEEDDEEDDENAGKEEGAFAPLEIPDRCPTVSCHHRFRFSSQQELNTYFDGATVESMAKNMPSVDLDVLNGARVWCSRQ